MKSMCLPAPLARAVAFFACLLGGTAAADVHTLYATLRGAQEVPPVSTPGVGECTITLDDVTGMVTVSGSFSGLTTAASAAHIHGPAPIGMNAGVLVPLTETGGTSGTVSGSATLLPANVTDMLNGLTYVNVHTSMHGGGEIRGQIVAQVPGVAGGWLIALAVLGVAGGVFLLVRRPALAS